MREFLRPSLLVVVAAVLGSCSGGSTMPSTGGQTAAVPYASSAKPVIPDVSSAPDVIGAITTSPGAVNGEVNQYTPEVGDYAGGGHGDPVDTLGCFPTMVQNKYHVHIFLGVIYNKTLIANPHAIGMVDPGQPVNGFVNSARCIYRVHTHDSSGIVHLELDRTLSDTAPAPFDLQTVLDVWGVPHTPASFGPFNGPIHIYTGNVSPGTLVVSKYQPYSGTVDSVPLRSHTVVWIEIGSNYYVATQLPSVRFYMEY